MLLLNFIGRNLAAFVAILTAILAILAAINGAYAAAFVLSLSACAPSSRFIRYGMRTASPKRNASVSMCWTGVSL